MSKVRIGVVVLLVGILGVGTVSAQQGGGAGTLAGQDYGEIEALYGRYNQGSDFRDAELFLSAFSEDAVIERPDGSSVRGMDALRTEREQRYQGQSGDVGRRHWTGSYLITATADGAKGRAYYVLFDVTTRPPTMTVSGYYADEFVRTPDGWRIKHRVINRDLAGE
jgi:hypothetical protein